MLNNYSVLLISQAIITMLIHILTKKLSRTVLRRFLGTKSIEHRINLAETIIKSIALGKKTVLSV